MLEKIPYVPSWKRPKAQEQKTESQEGNICVISLVSVINIETDADSDDEMEDENQDDMSDDESDDYIDDGVSSDEIDDSVSEDEIDDGVSTVAMEVSIPKQRLRVLFEV